MMKKGFTLIELLVVIAVLGIILAIIIPNAYKSLTNSKENSYKIEVEHIKDAARNCVTEKGIRCTDGNEESTGEFVSDTRYTILLGTLISGGYINGEIKDPLNGGVFSDSFEIYVMRKANGAYEFDAQ